MSESSKEQKPAITDEGARLKVVEIIQSGVNKVTSGGETELAEGRDGNPESVAAEVSDTESDKESVKRTLSPEDQAKLLKTLKTRLADKPQGYKRPEDVVFSEVKAALEARPDLMYGLAQMENSGGQVDILAIEGNEFVFCDFAKETPQSRCNLTYYQVQKIAKDEWGVDIQSEQDWRVLQKLGAFDTNSWIWLKSEDIIDTDCARTAYRDGGSLFVFDEFYPDFHNLLRGWRASLRVPKA